MKTRIIRNIPDEDDHDLRVLAAENDCSVEEMLRRIIRQAVRG